MTGAEDRGRLLRENSVHALREFSGVSVRSEVLEQRETERMLADLVAARNNPARNGAD